MNEKSLSKNLWIKYLEYTFISTCPYFDSDGNRRGYDVDNYELLIAKKYEEATHRSSKIMQEDLERENEKKALFKALEIFQAPKK